MAPRATRKQTYVTPFTCANPDEFLFWDGIHPSKAVHTIVSQEAATVLAQ